MGSSEGKVSKVECLTKNLDDDLENLNEDFDALQSTKENIDNNLWWNNINLRGLKGDFDRQDINQYLIDIFATWIISSQDISVSIIAAYHIGVYRDSDK